jgi:hypothetical protein
MMTRLWKVRRYTIHVLHDGFRVNTLMKVVDFYNQRNQIMAVAKKDAEFVRTWQNSNNAAEVAKSLGENKATVTNRAAQFRKHGVPLQRFMRQRTSRDYSELAKMAKSMMNGNGGNGARSRTRARATEKG